MKVLEKNKEGQSLIFFQFPISLVLLPGHKEGRLVLLETHHEDNLHYHFSFSSIGKRTTFIENEWKNTQKSTEKKNPSEKKATVVKQKTLVYFLSLGDVLEWETTTKIHDML